MNDYQEIEIKKSHPKRKWVLVIFVFIFLFVIFFIFKTEFAFSIIGGGIRGFLSKTISILPLSEDREIVDVLVLGIRGRGNPPGELLTDTIMVIRYQKNTEKAAVISIPRDLYVDIPGHYQKEKINFAYAFGEEKRKGLSISKKVVENVTGLNIDYVVCADLKAFEEIIDILGGITVWLDRPFLEETQWAKEGKENSPYWKKIKKNVLRNEEGEKIEKEVWAFYLPKGRNFLDAQAAAYYIRSRFSTSDFDRIRRQQQVLIAIKDKVFSLGVISNPVKISNIFKSLRNHVQFSGNLSEILVLSQILNQINFQEIKTKTFDVSDQGLLYSETIKGSYVLLPKAGDFSEIKKECQDIFEP